MLHHSTKEKKVNAVRARTDLPVRHSSVQRNAKNDATHAYSRANSCRVRFSTGKTNVNENTKDRLPSASNAQPQLTQRKRRDLLGNKRSILPFK
jgi:hypothetical protein